MSRAEHKDTNDMADLEGTNEDESEQTVEEQWKEQKERKRRFPDTVMKTMAAPCTDTKVQPKVSTEG